MKCFLLDDTGTPDGKLYLAFGEDAVKAAESLIARIGGNSDVNRFGVSGSWDVAPDTHIVVSEWWPHFTCDPDARTAISVVRGMKP